MIRLPNQIKQMLHTMHSQGYEAYVVGGCVRDALIGRETNDYDITTNALPVSTIEIFSDFAIIKTGIKHGTVTVIVQNMPIEITTYRIDGDYSDHRRPDKVDFSRELKVDLERRDFTINAMAYNETSGIIDLFNGKLDINNKIIRCVGNPNKRFQEDALRIIRALRFSSTLGFQIDDNTSESIHRNKKLLNNISIERITIEFSKMICGENIDKILMTFSDVIAVIIPQLHMNNESKQQNEKDCNGFSHIIRTIVNTPSVVHLRLASLLHHIAMNHSYCEEGIVHHCQKESAEMAREILQNMRYDNDLIRNVYTLIFQYDFKLIVNEKYVKRWMNQLTPIVLKDILLLHKAHEFALHSDITQKILAIEEMNRLIDRILLEGTCYEIKDLAIKGDEILKLGVQPGVIVGEILGYLLDEVIEENVANTKEDLIRLTQSYINNINKEC